MTNIIKKWWFWLVILMLFLALLAGWFYWFQLRPLKIKEGCNWVERTTGGNDVADFSNIKSESTNSITSDFWDKSDAWAAAGRPMKHIPVSKYWGKTTNDQYNLCLRLKGLK